MAGGVCWSCLRRRDGADTYTGVSRHSKDINTRTNVRLGGSPGVAGFGSYELEDLKPVSWLDRCSIVYMDKLAGGRRDGSDGDSLGGPQHTAARHRPKREPPRCGDRQAAIA